LHIDPRAERHVRDRWVGG
jgi:hypothetical protein